MPRNKIKYSKLILTGLIWIPLFLEVWNGFCLHFFDFSPLTPAHWQSYFDRFIRSDWIIQTGRDWSLFLCMILTIPLLFTGWYLAYRFNWGRLIFRTVKKITPAPIRQTPPEHRSFKPAQLRVQTGAIMHVNPAQTPPQEPSPPVRPANPSARSQTPAKPSYTDEAEVQEMLAQTAGLKADFFPHVKLDGSYASFALSTEKKAAIVAIINRPDSTLAVDTEIDILKSDWFFETGTISAPAKDVIAIAKNLHENEPDSVALPVILLMGGTLLNVDETLDYFEKNDVLLLRTDAVQADSIPLFSDFVQEYFAAEDNSESTAATEPTNSEQPPPPMPKEAL